jgi:hypothetical protein
VEVGKLANNMAEKSGKGNEIFSFSAEKQEKKRFSRKESKNVFLKCRIIPWD